NANGNPGSISKSQRKTGSRDNLHHTPSSSALWLCRSCACSLRREGRWMRSAETVLTSPPHPYTKALFHSIPTVFDRPENTRKTKLPAILGDSARSLPIRGCPFEPRCAGKMDICKEREPAAVNLSASHTVSCFKYES